MGKGATIEWTRPKLERLKKQTREAGESGNESFWFEDEGKKHEILVNFAKYLIEYLEGGFAMMDRDATAQLLPVVFAIAMKLDLEFYQVQAATGQCFGFRVEADSNTIQMKYAGIVIWDTTDFDSVTPEDIEADVREEIANLIVTVRTLRAD